MHEPLLAVSSGEPAGIGPDICIGVAARRINHRIAFLGDPELLGERARMLDVPVDIKVHERPDTIGPHRAQTLDVLPVSLRGPVSAGRLSSDNAEYVLQVLRLGAALCQSGECAALVTAPVQKSVIVESGTPFTGHTEYLAKLTGARHPVMLLAGPRLRVALATTHLPLRAVADSLSIGGLVQTLRVLHADLNERFAINSPRILVLGLNPHAGEGGTLGREEIDIISPALDMLREEGLALTGPVAADTAFTPESVETHDAVLAMYHDQGLPALKAQGFGEIVNVTLGLPIVRTSVDHGTALALAGTGSARADSLDAAIALAAHLVHAIR